ncbi:unnamed protein product [Cercospora beticola]|nr:unnamed protein product [Cercospora beticola]
MAPLTMIHFVDGRGDGRPSRQARSHAAKMARLKKRATVASVEYALQQLAATLAAPSSHYGYMEDAETSRQAYAITPTESVMLGGLASLASAESGSEEENIAVAAVEPAFSVPEVLPATLGALSPSCIAPAASTQTIEYMTQVFWPQFHMHGDDHQAPLLHAYCDKSLFYHYLNYVSAVHLAVLSNRITRPATVKRLVHYQSEVITLVRDNVSKSISAEWAIILVIALAAMDYQECLMQPEVEELMFVPYMPTADWLNVFGRFRPHASHFAGMHALVDRAGGFHALPSNGLRGRVAWADLVQAAMTGCRPTTPCIWKETTSITPLHNQSAAAVVLAFGDVPGSLPREMLDALQQLAALDILFSRTDFTNVDKRTMYQLKMLRNIVEYDMICLRSWKELSEVSRESSYCAVYEIVRIVSLLYCQAVILGLPPHSGWHLKLLEELRDVVELSRVLEWSTEQGLDLLVWALCIAGIGALGSKMEVFWANMFGQATRLRSLHDRSSIRDVAKQFLWQDAVCGKGLDMLCARQLG